MAIIIDRTITIKDDKATLDRPLYLYIGDGDITCLFTIEEKKKAATFGSINKTNSITENASYGEVRIYKPDKGSDATSRLIFTDRAEIIDDKLQVIFSYKNIDDFSEAGIHKLQIHLYDDDDSERNRFTIPPVDINVLLPVGYDNNATDEAIVGYSLLDARGEEVPTFDEEGNYNKTEWQTGDIITKNKLNKIEDALYEINAANDDFVTNEVFDAALKDKASTNHSHKEYATKTELNGKAPTAHSHTGYAPSSHTHSGYASNNHTHSNYAPTSHTHDDVYVSKANMPTRLGQLANDKGYITSAEIPANYVTESELSSYNYIAKPYVDNNFATISYVQDAINKAQIPDGDTSGINLSAYALKTELITGLADKANKIHTHSEYLTTATLDSYATINYVNDLVDNVKIDPEDLAEYAKKSEIPTIPTNVSYFTNDAKYVTQGYVDNAVANVQVDLSGYATTEAMNAALDGKANEGHTHENYALKTDIPTVPTKVGQLENDKNYATTTQVNKAVSDLDNKIIDKNYATKSEVPTKVSDLENDKNYATEDAVNGAVNDAVTTINNNLINNYATKEEIPTVPTNVSELENDKGYITSGKDILGNYYITRIEIVDELPDYEEPGVLYIVRA